jgi:ubiquinone/menaquinone biosynthesis C-methylase UbiE
MEFAMVEGPDPSRFTRCFTGLAGDYASHRPSYPPEAIAKVLKGFRPPIRVADVGCGTGISTRLLAAQGAEVVGIEPNEDMLRAAAGEPAPPRGSVSYRRATAEKTDLPDGSQDLVVCAQSFHWFDAAAALREFHRVLVPGGRLALVWNIRDRGDPFTAAYSEIMNRAEADARQAGRVGWREYAGDPLAGGWFRNVAFSSFPYQMKHDLAGLLGRARSASYFPRQDPLRGELEEELAVAFGKHQSGGQVAIVYKTRVTLAERA